MYTSMNVRTCHTEDMGQFHHSKNKFCELSLSYILSSLPNSWQPLICFLSLGALLTPKCPTYTAIQSRFFPTSQNALKIHSRCMN